MLSEPVVTLYCDTPGCEAKEEFGLTVTARRGYDERDLEREIKHAGWRIVDDNTHYCPMCAEETEETEETGEK